VSTHHESIIYASILHLPNNPFQTLWLGDISPCFPLTLPAHHSLSPWHPTRGFPPPSGFASPGEWPSARAVVAELVVPGPAGVCLKRDDFSMSHHSDNTTGGKWTGDSACRGVALVDIWQVIHDEAVLCCEQ